MEAGVNSVKTVVFADIAGSTALYEALGNERAAALVAELTQGIGASIQAHGGRVVKNLGDGVLGVFADAQDAVQAVVDRMRAHRQWARTQPQALRVEMRVGLASGDVVDVGGDCYGDAVNVAARLCERAGIAEIWATEALVAGLWAPRGVRFIRLGLLEVRGKADPLLMYQVEWREEEDVDSLTMPAGLMSDFATLATGPAEIQLSWRGDSLSFTSAEAPVQVGRAPDSQLCIADPRVSRLHARVDWRNGAFVLTDLSSFGTWVRFQGSGTPPVQLRRDSCLLHGTGEIALGVPFADASAPTVAFQVAGSSMRLG